MRQQDAEINDHENITESLHEKIQVLEEKAEGFQKGICAKECAFFSL